MNNKTILTNDDEKQICSLYLNGYPIRDLSFKYHICIPRLKYILIRHNIIIRKTGELITKQYNKDLINHIIDLYQSGIGTTSICQLVKLNYNEIRKILINNKITIRKTNDIVYRGNTARKQKERLKQLIPDILLDYKSGLSWADLIIKYKISGITLMKVLKDNKAKLRMYKLKEFINHNYFQKINTSKKAYFLGLLYADGTHNTNRHQIAISLISIDDYLLQALQKEINHVGELRTIKYDNPNHKQASALCWTSQIMSADLNRLGVVKNKSLILDFPTKKQVPSDLLPHFIRGYFDGDGCISIYKRKRGSLDCNVSFCCSKSFGKGLQKILINNFNISCGYYEAKGRKISVVSIHSRDGLIKIFKLLYPKKYKLILMKRKYDKFIQFFKEKELHY